MKCISWSQRLDWNCQVLVPERYKYNVKWSMWHKIHDMLNFSTLLQHPHIVALMRIASFMVTLTACHIDTRSLCKHSANVDLLNYIKLWPGKIDTTETRHININHMCWDKVVPNILYLLSATWCNGDTNTWPTIVVYTRPWSRHGILKSSWKDPETVDSCLWWHVRRVSACPSSHWQRTLDLQGSLMYHHVPRAQSSSSCFWP